MYWWDGGGEDEKGLIVMFTTVYSELSLAPDDSYTAVFTSGKDCLLLEYGLLVK